MRYLLVVLLCGCQPVLRTDTVRAGGDVRGVRVDVEAGDVTVTSGDVDVLTVERTLRGPAGSVVVTQAVEQGVLRLDGSCRALAPCSVDLHLTVPRETRVDVHTGDGDVVLVDVADARVDVGTGRIEASGEMDRLHARVGWGSADVRLVSAPIDLAVELAGGDARVEIPPGVYALDLAAFGGVEARGVSDGDGPRVHVRTQAGAATVIGSAPREPS